MGSQVIASVRWWPLQAGIYSHFPFGIFRKSIHRVFLYYFLPSNRGWSHWIVICPPRKPRLPTGQTVHVRAGDIRALYRGMTDTPLLNDPGLKFIPDWSILKVYELIMQNIIPPININIRPNVFGQFFHVYWLFFLKITFFSVNLYILGCIPVS